MLLVSDGAAVSVGSGGVAPVGVASAGVGSGGVAPVVVASAGVASAGVAPVGVASAGAAFRLSRARVATLPVGLE